MQDEGAQIPWISTGGAGIDQFPARGAKEKGGGRKKTRNLFTFFCWWKARLDFCLALPALGGSVIALVPQ